MTPTHKATTFPGVGIKTGQPMTLPGVGISSAAKQGSAEERVSRVAPFSEPNYCRSCYSTFRFLVGWGAIAGLTWLVAGNAALHQAAQPEPKPPSAKLPYKEQPAPPSQGLNNTEQRRGDLALAARQILHQYCRECHGGAKQQGRLVISHAESLLRQDLPVPWVKPGEPSASQIVHFLEEGSMPPGNRPRPTPEEVRLLREWIAAGAPAFPATFDEEYILATLARDLAQRGRDAPYGRYVSLAHCVSQQWGTMGNNSLRSLESALRRHLHQCGLKELVPIDPPATIFRLDIRAVHWHSRELFLRLQQGAPAGVYPLSPYDLLLLEYPLAENAEGASRWPSALQDYLQAARLIRPVPYLRGDWLSAALASSSPLAEELRSLTTLGQSLEQQGWPPAGREKEAPCGPVPRPFHSLPFPAPSASPPSKQPMTAWYRPATSPANLPKGWQAELISPQGQTMPRVRKGEPFRLRLQVPQDVHFTLLMIWCTGHIEIVETNRGGFLKAGEHILTPREAEAFRIVDILTGEKETREFFLLLASPQPQPPHTHRRRPPAASPPCELQRRFPIERFLLETQGRSAPLESLLVPIPLSE
jgi:hypothetical protein